MRGNPVVSVCSLAVAKRPPMPARCERLDKAFGDSGDQLRDLLLAMTQSDGFTLRSTEGGAP